MRIRLANECLGGFRVRAGLGLLAIFLTASGAFGAPGWWSERGVVLPGAATNDYAAVNAGQAKWFATNAYDELQTYLPHGAGPVLTALVGGFSRSNNYVWLNQGQLKALATPFYDRLIAEHYTNTYPWTVTAADDANYAAANIGQLKRLFDFDIRSLTNEVAELEDADADGLPDAWEQQIIDADPADAITGLAQVLPGGDFDGDGISNADEYRTGTSPVSAASRPPLVRFVQATQLVTEATAAQTVMIGITLSAAATGTVRVTVVGQGGTATEGEDYSFAGQTVELAAGVTGATVMVAIPAEPVNLLETVETVLLNLAVEQGPAVVGVPAKTILEIIDSVADSDGDGLPDAWEARYFINATVARPERDPDGDGWTNLQEYRRGGHPRFKWTADETDRLGLRVETVME